MVKGSTAGPQTQLPGIAQPKCHKQGNKIVLGTRKSFLQPVVASSKETMRHFYTCTYCNKPRGVYSYRHSVVSWYRFHTFFNKCAWFLQMHRADCLSDLWPMPELWALGAAQLSILCLRWWNFSLISESWAVTFSSHDSILHLSDKSKPEQKRWEKFLKFHLILGALIQQGILWCCMWRTLREIHCTIFN